MNQSFELSLTAGGFALLFFTNQLPDYGIEVLAMAVLVFMIRVCVDLAEKI